VTAVATTPRLAVEVGGLRLKNPLIAASGTFGYGVEYAEILNLSSLGGLVSKGLYLAPRDGCATPRIVETPSGLLNAIGLQGVGVRAFVEKVLPALRDYDTAVLVNVCGDTVDEYAEVTRIVDQAEGVAGVEINISCPNVKKGGMAFGGDPRMTSEVVAAVRKATRLPVIPKLSPNVADIAVFARASRGSGRGRRLLHQHPARPRRRRGARRPRLAFGTGGLSGPPSAPSPCAWPGRPRARSRSR
jgi:dihydroorotate dehydrogenase (NAD+) catalytic subunit